MFKKIISILLVVMVALLAWGQIEISKESRRIARIKHLAQELKEGDSTSAVVSQLGAPDYGDDIEYSYGRPMDWGIFFKSRLPNVLFRKPVPEYRSDDVVIFLKEGSVTKIEIH